MGKDGRGVDNQPVQLWDCNTGTPEHQMWIIDDSVMDGYGGRIRYSANRNMCLDKGRSDNLGSKLHLWNCDTAKPWSNTIWALEKFEEDPGSECGTYRLRLTDAPYKDCMDVTDGKKYNGNSVQTWECTTKTP